MATNELIVAGYVHYTIEREFYFNQHVVSNDVKNTILMYLPSLIKMMIPVSLTEIKVHNKDHTVYSFTFHIMDDTCLFSARYSSLYKFHQSLLQDTTIRTSFGANVPKFPGKKWWKDFTKQANYTKRAGKLLKYMAHIASNQDVLKSHIFQNGIYLPKHLRDALSNTIRGHYWPPLSGQSDDTDHVTTAGPFHTPEVIMPQPQRSEINLEDALEDLTMHADQSFIDISIQNERCMLPYYGSYHFLNDMYSFQMDDILPWHLLMDDKDAKYIHVKTEAHTHISHSRLFEISTEFFPIKIDKTFSVTDDQRIDNIIVDIKHAILESCDITV
eukprot:684484_1